MANQSPFWEQEKAGGPFSPSGLAWSCRSISAIPQLRMLLQKRRLPAWQMCSHGIRREFWHPGTKLRISSEGQPLGAEVVSLPFISSAGS